MVFCLESISPENGAVLAGCLEMRVRGGEMIGEKEGEEGGAKEVWVA